jgi:hypothetical protein
MAVAVMALAGPLLSSAPAHAAVPIIFVQPDNSTRVYGHQCKSLGTDGIGNEAVACSDLAVRGTTSQTEVWAVNQIICQRAKVIFACEGASTTAKVAFGGTLSGYEFGRKHNYCGSFGGSRCPSGRFQQGSYHYVWTTNGCYELWGVAIENQVQTRSGIVVQGPNVASAHYLVCPA